MLGKAARTTIVMNHEMRASNFLLLELSPRWFTPLRVQTDLSAARKSHFLAGDQSS
jgi:hypothetical protein